MPPVNAVGGPKISNPSRGDPTTITKRAIAIADKPQRIRSLGVEYNMIPQTIMIILNKVRTNASGSVGGLKVSGKAIENSKLPPKSKRIDEALCPTREFIEHPSA